MAAERPEPARVLSPTWHHEGDDEKLGRLAQAPARHRGRPTRATRACPSSPIPSPQPIAAGTVAIEERAGLECGEERRKIGEEVREQLEFVPASLLVLQHVRPKYACKRCASHVVIAPRLPEPIEKGLPGAGLLAHVAVSKYADHLPLHRQEGIFRTPRRGAVRVRRCATGWPTRAACCRRSSRR